MPRTDPDRERRLAEALRANLRRRKGQARERAHDGDPGDGADESALTDSASDPAEPSADLTD